MYEYLYAYTSLRFAFTVTVHSWKMKQNSHILFGVRSGDPLSNFGRLIVRWFQILLCVLRLQCPLPPPHPRLVPTSCSLFLAGEIFLTPDARQRTSSPLQRRCYGNGFPGRPRVDRGIDRTLRNRLASRLCPAAGASRVIEVVRCTS